MRKRIPTTHTNLDLTNIDHVPSSGTHSGSNAMLYVFDNNEAVIKMLIKCRSPTMRHVSRTHRVALDWLFDWINFDSKIQIRYIDTKHQLADILTKGNLTRDEWNNILHFVQHQPFQLYLQRSEFQLPRRWLKGCRNRREKKEVWQNRNLQRRTCLHMFRQAPHPQKVRLHPKVQLRET